MSDGSFPNYVLIGKLKKAEIKLEIEKIPSTKEIILKILESDKLFWKESKEKQKGMERNVLIRKVLDFISINAKIFDIAIEELETNQEILSFLDGNLTRYLLFSL
jgi:hypothetical protein